MVSDIVHTAVARKMLCNPVNSLIADTEFACAAGMVLRLIKAEKDRQRAEENSTMRELSRWLLGTYADRLEGEFDIPCQNLIAMVRNYHAEENPFTARLKELFALGCEREISYPSGRFL